MTLRKCGTLPRLIRIPGFAPGALGERLLCLYSDRAMKRPVDFGDPKDWPGLLPGFENVCNDEEREIAELEPAWGRAATFFRTGFRFGHPRGSIRSMSLEQVHRHLGVYRTRCEAGDTLSLLQAISLCAEENLPLPEWLALAFQAQMNAFLHPGNLHSLDQVFSSRNVPTNSAKKAAAARQDWKLGGQLYQDVWDIAQKDETLLSFDSAVERLLARTDYGVRKTKAKTLITMIEKSQSRFIGRDFSLSRFLANRRKLLT